MKRTKIFLGISAFVLAVASIAATKANRRFVSYNYWTTTSVGACHNGAPACSGGTNQCTFSIASEAATVYQQTSITQGCLTKLMDKGE